jgi:preprotein translocase subunit SecD
MAHRRALQPCRLLGVPGRSDFSGGFMLHSAIAAGTMALSLWAATLDQSTVKFEVRRAEGKPAAGLTEAKVGSTNEKVYLHQEIELSNEDIAAAKAIADKSQGNVIEVDLTRQGQEKMAKLTKAHLGKPLAIMIDGKVIAAPVVHAVINSKAVISGNFSKEEAAQIAAGIKGK